MKFRTDFVTNSSSSSFIYYGFYSKELLDYVTELIRKGYVYQPERNQIDPDTLRGLLVSKRQDPHKGVVDCLTFFPRESFRSMLPEKTGFQIAEEFRGQSSNSFSALLSYFDLSSLSENEADAIRKKLGKLTTAAKKKGQILSAHASGMTDDANDHFTEADYFKTLFKTRHSKYRDSDELVSCRNKNSASIEINTYCDLDTIGPSAFENMTALISFKAEVGNDRICENAFSGCSALEVFRNREPYEYEIATSNVLTNFPDSSNIDTGTIEKNAFRNCSSLKAISFSHSRVIMSSAFEGCEKLEAIEFGSCIERIEQRAFASCTALKDVYFDERSFDPYRRYGSENEVKYLLSPTAFVGCENVLFHVYEESPAHLFVAKRGFAYKLRDRFPMVCEVKDMHIRKSRLAESLSVGAQVHLGKKEYNYNSLFLYNDAGKEIGSLSLLPWQGKCLIRDLDFITAKVLEFTPLSEIRLYKPKADSAKLTIILHSSKKQDISTVFSGTPSPKKETPKAPKEKRSVKKKSPKGPENKQPAKEESASSTSLSGYVCCLTGDFNFGSKEDVERYIIARGGTYKSSLTKAVNMLIIGGLGSDRYSFGSYGRKYVEAKERQDKGENMTILTEEEFFERFT